MSRRVAAASVLLVAVLAAHAKAFARERLAVMIVVDDDQVATDRGLSDNLTEIAIAELAEGHDRDLVGARELRAMLAESSEAGGLAGCLAQPPCLARAGELAGASRAVVGTVHRQAAAYALTLALVEMRTAARQVEVTRAVPLDLGALIAAVREGVAALFVRPAPPSAPLPLPAALAARVREDSPPAGATLSAPVAPSPPKLAAPPDKTKGGPSLSSITGYSAAGLAVVVFSASAVLGAIADEPPSGATRLEKEKDLSRRGRDADLANAFLLTGALLTAVAAAALIWHWRH